jgi:8-oxo-dGTP diphosphatase
MSDKKFDYLHTLDIGLIRFNSERKQIEIMVALREKEPFRGKWALPGVVINGDTEDQSILHALERLMASPKIGFHAKYHEQVGTTESNNSTRDPRCWSSSTFYFGIVEENTRLQPHQRFVSIDSIASGNEQLAFDHNILVAKIKERLVSKSAYSSLPILLLNEYFTVLDTVNVCEAITDEEISKIGQRKRCERLIQLGFIENTNQKTKAARGAPQTLMRQVIGNEVHFFSRSINA